MVVRHGTSGVPGDVTVDPAAILDDLGQSPEGLVLIVMLCGVALVVGYALRTGVPPMASSPAAKRAMLEMLPDRIDGPIYDLGSGWGGLAFALAGRYPNNTVIGIELSPLPYWISRTATLIVRRPNLRFRRADFLRTPLNDAGAATCYLMIGAMRRLEPKLRAEMRTGAVVVSHAFAFVDWEPEARLMVSEAASAWIYRYRQSEPPFGQQAGPGSSVRVASAWRRSSASRSRRSFLSLCSSQNPKASTPPSINPASTTTR